MVKISRIPNNQVRFPTSRAQILLNSASREAVNSRIPSSYFAFSRIPHCISVKSRIPKIPFQTLLILFVIFEYFAGFTPFGNLHTMRITSARNYRKCKGKLNSQTVVIEITLHFYALMATPKQNFDIDFSSPCFNCLKI